MKTFLLILLIVLGIVILFCCSAGDYAEGCCGVPGQSNTPEKDMKWICWIGPIAIIAFMIVLNLYFKY